MRLTWRPWILIHPPGIVFIIHRPLQHQWYPNSILLNKNTSYHQSMSIGSKTPSLLLMISKKEICVTYHQPFILISLPPLGWPRIFILELHVLHKRSMTSPPFSTYFEMFFHDHMLKFTVLILKLLNTTSTHRNMAQFPPGSGKSNNKWKLLRPSPSKLRLRNSCMQYLFIL